MVKERTQIKTWSEEYRKWIWVWKNGAPWQIKAKGGAYGNASVRGLYGKPPKCEVILEGLEPAREGQCQAIMIRAGGYPTRCEIAAGHSAEGGAVVSGGGHDWLGS